MGFAVVQTSTYEVEGCQQGEASQSSRQTDQHVAMQIKGLQSAKDAALRFLILGEFLRVNIREQDLVDHLQLIVSSYKSGEIHTLRPTTVTSTNGV